MRTTLDLDEKLLKEAMKYSGKKTKAAAVNEALAAYVRARKLEGLLALEGKIQIEDNWKELERLELEEQERVFRRRR